MRDIVTIKFEVLEDIDGTFFVMTKKTYDKKTAKGIVKVLNARS